MGVTVLQKTSNWTNNWMITTSAPPKQNPHLIPIEAIWTLVIWFSGAIFLLVSGVGYHHKPMWRESKGSMYGTNTYIYLHLVDFYGRSNAALPFSSKHWQYLCPWCGLLVNRQSRLPHEKMHFLDSVHQPIKHLYIYYIYIFKHTHIYNISHAYLHSSRFLQFQKTNHKTLGILINLNFPEFFRGPNFPFQITPASSGAIGRPEPPWQSADLPAHKVNASPWFLDSLQQCLRWKQPAPPFLLPQTKNNSPNLHRWCFFFSFFQGRFPKMCQDINWDSLT